MRCTLFLLPLLSLACASALPTTPFATQTVPGLGKAQGVTIRDDRVLLYGDATTGVLTERVLQGTRLSPPTRQATLTVAGQNVLNHPTGLAIHPGLPTFLGNTVTATKQGRIYTIDLERLLSEGTADHALLNDCVDDLAVQGSRPEYVRLGNRWLLATSDYGPGPNYIRLYDPARLARAHKTSEPGILIQKTPCGPWVQNLHWIDETHTLVIIQNITEGRQWRLTLIPDLTAPDFRTGKIIDIPNHNDELEGFSLAHRGLSLFITSSREHNVTFAR